MKIKIMAVLLLLMITFTSCSTTKNDSSSQVKAVTIYFRDDSSIATNSSESEVEVDSEVDSKPKTTTTTTAATTEKKVTAEVKQTTKVVNAAAPVEKTTTAAQVTKEEPEYLVFKPSTHYVHRSTCRWNDSSCYKIEDTNDIQVRLCSECNPNIKVITPYVEVTTTKATTAATTQATTQAATAAAATTTKSTTTTTPASSNTTEEEVEVSSSYRLPYVLSDDEWWWICKVVCSETGHCSEKQQKAVANTIFNRLIWAAEYGNYNPFPTTAIAIIQQPGQYDAYKYWRSDSRLKPGGSLWNQTMQYLKEAASEPDFTNGAIGYYNPAMSGYLSAFENNRALLLAYVDGTGRFFKLNPYCYSRK